MCVEAQITIAITYNGDKYSTTRGTRRIPGMRQPNRNGFLRDVILRNTAGLKYNLGSLTVSGKTTFVCSISISLLLNFIRFTIHNGNRFNSR